MSLAVIKQAVLIKPKMLEKMVCYKSSKVNIISKKSKIFSDFYQEYFGTQWPDIYQGLKQPSQCCALVNKYNKNSNPLQITMKNIKAKMVKLRNKSKDIDLLCYKMNDTRFPKPEVNALGLSNYYLLDASSLLPVLALDIEPNNYILDLCAGPGGKSYAILELLPSGTLVANEPNWSRRKRLEKVIAGCIPANYDTTKVHVSGFDGIKMGNVESNLYDRVLVDVPCSADRHGVLTNFINSSWSLSKSKRYSVLQFELLRAAIAAVVPKGIIVYSTCTLSPYENDQVVERLLRSSDDVLECHDPLQWVNGSEFAIYKQTKYGILVLPTVVQNWGPLYFCKLQKLSN